MANDRMNMFQLSCIGNWLSQFGFGPEWTSWEGWEWMEPPFADWMQGAPYRSTRLRLAITNL